MASFYKFTCFYRTAGGYGISSDAAAADRSIGFDSCSRRSCITFDTCRIGSTNAVSTDAVNSFFQRAHIYAVYCTAANSYAVEAVIGYRRTVKYAGAADTCRCNCHTVISAGLGQVTAVVDSNTVDAGNSCHNARFHRYAVYCCSCCFRITNIGSFTFQSYSSAA